MPFTVCMYSFCLSFMLKSSSIFLFLIQCWGGPVFHTGLCLSHSEAALHKATTKQDDHVLSQIRLTCLLSLALRPLSRVVWRWLLFFLSWILRALHAFVFAFCQQYSKNLQWGGIFSLCETLEQSPGLENVTPACSGVKIVKNIGIVKQISFVSMILLYFVPFYSELLSVFCICSTNLCCNSNLHQTIDDGAYK